MSASMTVTDVSVERDARSSGGAKPRSQADRKNPGACDLLTRRSGAQKAVRLIRSNNFSNLARVVADSLSLISGCRSITSAGL